jgi:hypothetical protein
MLTAQELEKLKLNEQFAREVLSQAEKRLADLIDAKKALDTKATALFAAYITLATATSGVGLTMLHNPSLEEKALPFFVASGCFAAGAIIFIMFLKPGKFGYMGTTPKMWFTEEWVSAEGDSIAYMLAYTAIYYQKRIDNNTKAISARYRMFSIGMWTGLAGAAIFAATFLRIMPG